MRRMIFFIAAVLMTICTDSWAGDTTYVSDNQYKVVKVKNADYTGRPKNIILMIGDGMGLSQVQAGETANKGKLNLHSCSHSGFVNTKSADKFITDSAAGGTAYATGQRTNNGMIAVLPDETKLESIVTLLSKDEMNTGLVASCKITHATPASFVAQEVSRNSYQNIALDIFENEDIDLLIGGGYNDFAKRDDKRNLVDEYKAKNINVATEDEGVSNASGLPFVALLSEGHSPKVTEGREGKLPMYTKKAIELLDNEKGFFLMVEGSQIDWGGHKNDLGYIVEEMMDFDQTIGEALKFASKDKETLIIITADHETGGLTLTGGDTEAGMIKGAFSTGSHTGTMVPVFAYGPGADLFTGIMDNTDIYHKILKALKRK